MLADNLRQLRQENNLNQKEFADMFGISTVSLSSYENGTKMPTLELLINISQKFNISLDELCDNKSSFITNIPEIIDFLYNLILDDKIYLAEEIESYNDTYLIYGAFFKHKILEDFLKEMYDMVNLYNCGTIKKSLLDLWIKDKKSYFKEKYKNNKYIGMTKEEYEEHRKQLEEETKEGYEEYLKQLKQKKQNQEFDMDEDLPF